MGYLFENFEKVDIQEERRKTAIAEKKLKEAEKKQKEAEQKAEQKAEQSYISACREFACTEEETIARFIVRYQVSPSEAEKKVREYWDKAI